MAIPSSDIVQVARSREKYDGPSHIDLPALEEEERARLEGDRKPDAPKEKRDLTSFSPLSVKKRNALIALIAILLLVIAAAYMDRIFRGNSIAHGVSVSGVDVGGDSPTEAKKILSAKAKKALDTPLIFTMGKDRVSISSQDLGLSYNIDATIARAQKVDDSYNPISTISGFVQRYSAGKNIDPVAKYDDNKFDEVATNLINEFSKGRVNAGVTIKDTTVTVVKAKSGTGVSLEQAKSALKSSLATFSRSPQQLKSEKSNAQITLAEAQSTAASIRGMLSADSQLTTPGGNSLTVTPAQLSGALVITPTGSQLIISVDAEKIRAALGASLSAVEVAPVDATFSVGPGGVSIVPSVAGKQVDFASAMEQWLNGEHNFTVNVIDVQPARDTAWAQKLNITETVSSYTTNFPAGQERIKNIRRAAEVVNNTVVVPGETFSLNDKLGRRTAENGYVKAPVYSTADGFFEDFGGGASQFSTTFFNAVYVGGYKDVAHSPHSIYISRYPLGRDATLNYGSIDMKFKNDSNSGMLIRTSVGPTSVTVVVYGNKEGRVVTLEGPKEISKTEIGTKYIDDPNMEAGKEKETHVGYPGLVVENYRTVDRPGQPGKKETYRWTYLMVPREVTRGSKTPTTAAPVPVAPAA